MAFDPPDGILDIGNATLRVGKLEVAETSGLNQGLQNIIKNDLLITENTEYTTDQKWGLKLPTTWVAEFEVKGHSGKYIDFNFYNENSASNAQGYNLTFMDTSLTLKYDGGNNLPITGDTVDSTLSLGDAGYGVATIPTIVGAYRKVNIFFERGVISVSIDGTRYLYFKESDGYNAVHGHPGVASRVVSTTGSAFVNLFIEQNADDSAFKNLRIVNGRFISDKTSNIAFIGGNLGVGVNSPKESLDILGNMHLTRVSNVSQIKVDSNVVTEYTGPHDRPLRKYPEVALSVASESASGEYGYKVAASKASTTFGTEYTVFDGLKGAAGANYIWRPYAYNGGTTQLYNTGTGLYDTTAITAAGEEVAQLDTNTEQGEWISVELPKAIKLTHFHIYTQWNSVGNLVDSGHLYAKNTSNDSWVKIHSFNGATTTSVEVPTVHHVNSTNLYKYFALIITKSAGQPTIGEWELYGHEEGSGSLDTTLKTVYNVPATTGTQLEVYYDGQDYTGVTSTVTDKAGTATNATIANTDSAITFDSTYKAWTFGGTDTRTSNIQSSALASTFSGDQVHSVALWFKCDVVSGDTLFSITQPSDPWEDGKKVISVRFSDESGGLRYLFWSNDIKYDGTEAKITKDIWYHLCVTYSGGGGTTENKKLYLNGNELHHTSTSGTYPGADLELPSGSVIRLGSRVQETTRFFGSIANFRLYSKALNAGQVQELYDYQKDYFLGSKSQVTLYKGHLGVGVTEPSGQLELAGDERIQEYPPRALTGYETLVEGHGVFCAYASSAYTSGSNADRLPYSAFDKVSGSSGLGDIWQSVDGLYNGGSGTNQSYTGSVRLAENLPNGHYLGLKMPYPVKITSFIMGAFFNSGYRGVGDGLIVGRNTNNPTWEVVHTLTNSFMAGVNGFNIAANAPALLITTPSIPIDNTKYYDEYALVVTGTLGSSLVTVSEWRLFGTPGPTTLDKGSLSLTRSLDVPRVSRYDVDTETPRPEKLVLDFDTTVNSSPTDISGEGNHGTFKGTASYSPADKAFRFDGAGATYIYTSGASGIPSGDAIYSIVGWVNVEPSITNFGQLLSFGSQWGVQTIGALSVNTSYGFQASIGGDAVKSPDGVITPNTWHHIAAVKVATGVCTVDTYDLYLDGVLITNKTYSGSNRTQNIGTGTKYLAVGGGFTGAASDAFDGLISNPKLYDVVLEPSEVKKLYNLGRTGRSMVISDTAVGIGKVPEAQLDVRGTARFVHAEATDTIACNSLAYGIGTNLTTPRDHTCLAQRQVVRGNPCVITFKLNYLTSWVPGILTLTGSTVNTNSSAFSGHYAVVAYRRLSQNGGSNPGDIDVSTMFAQNTAGSSFGTTVGGSGTFNIVYSAGNGVGSQDTLQITYSGSGARDVFVAECVEYSRLYY